MGRADIAVLLPVHDAPGELAETLASLAEQDTEFVVYLIDDGSSPPVSIKKDYSYPIQIVRLNENRGITVALNAGLDAIVGDHFRFIARIDAGDLALPGRFAAQRDFLDKHPDHVLVSSAYEVFDDSGRFMYVLNPPLHDDEIRRELFYRNPILHPGLMFRESIFRDGLRYDETFRAGQDYEIIRRLARIGKIANLPAVLMRYRVASDSITSRRRYRYFGRIRIQARYFEPLIFHSYFGLLRSLAASFVPFGAAHTTRKILNWRNKSRQSRNDSE